MTVWPFVAIVVLLAVNAFFVAFEFALLGSRRSRLEPLAEAGDKAAQRSLDAMRDLSAATGWGPARHHRGIADPGPRRRAGDGPPAGAGRRPRAVHPQRLDPRPRQRDRPAHRGVRPHGHRRDGPEEPQPHPSRGHPEGDHPPEPGLPGGRATPRVGPQRHGQPGHPGVRGRAPRRARQRPHRRGARRAGRGLPRGGHHPGLRRRAAVGRARLRRAGGHLGDGASRRDLLDRRHRHGEPTPRRSCSSGVTPACPSWAPAASTTCSASCTPRTCSNSTRRCSSSPCRRGSGAACSWCPASGRSRTSCWPCVGRGCTSPSVTEADGTTAGIVTLDDLLEELVGDITDEPDQP